jgi:hypothetical protein
MHNAGDKDSVPCWIIENGCEVEVLARTLPMPTTDAFCRSHHTDFVTIYSHVTDYSTVQLLTPHIDVSLSTIQLCRAGTQLLAGLGQIRVR